jgi:hypothetical protein
MKYLSGIKPTLIGDRGRDVVLSSSLTHVKYAYAGDVGSENLVAFNSFAPGAIAKAGGIFTGSTTLKTLAGTLITASSSSGIVTINMAFGNFFKLVLTENVVGFDIINIPPEAAMFTLIIEQDLVTNRSVAWVFNQGTIKWENATPVDVTSTRTNLDVFSFKTINSGSVWYAKANGQNFEGVGTSNPSDGTILSYETLYIEIDNVSYTNGSREILADGLGGTRPGNDNYPATYPGEGATLFKEAAHAQLYVEECDSYFDNGSTLWGSDGSGGYLTIDQYPPSTSTALCSADSNQTFFNNSIKVGTQEVYPDGIGGYDLGSVIYITSDYLGTYANNDPFEFVNNSWYSTDAPPTSTGKGTFGLFQTIGGSGNFYTNNSYDSATTSLGSCNWTLGYSLTAETIIVSADYKADGNGKVYLDCGKNTGDIVYTETIPCDAYSGYPCNGDYSGYQITYKFDLNAWTSSSIAGNGQGYFTIEGVRTA